MAISASAWVVTFPDLRQMHRDGAGFAVEAMIDADVARFQRRDMQPAMAADHAIGRQDLVGGGEEFRRRDRAAFGIKGGPARDDLPAMAQPGFDLGQMIADLEAHLAEIGRQQALVLEAPGGQGRVVGGLLIQEKMLDDGAVKLFRRRANAF